MKVELVAYTEGADHVCNLAAKNCVSEEMPELFEMDAEGYPYLIDSECKSLKHALASGHMSIAEHAVLTYSVSGVSRVTEIQLVRHRIGASYAIQSGRYCARDPTNYVMPESVTEDVDDLLAQRVIDYNRALRLLDDCMVEMGISAEDRRYFYPQGLMTNIVVTVNARELLHMASERMCTRAQWEIREMVTEMIRLAKEVAPALFENAGPKCMRLGYCPERKGCGRYPPKED